MATWETAFRVVRWDSSTFPAPSTLLSAFADLLRYAPSFGGRPLLGGILVSITRLIINFALSLLIGGALGLLLWRFKWLNEQFGPVFLGLQTLPSVCWVPIALLAIGNNERAVSFVVIAGSTFAIALALRDGLRSIPPIYQRVGAMLGTRGWRMYRHVLLPASLPALSSTLRQGFSFAWRSLMGAEVLFAVERNGLGAVLQMARTSQNSRAEIIAVMIVMVLIGMFADRFAFAQLECKIARQFGLTMEV